MSRRKITCPYCGLIQTYKGMSGGRGIVQAWDCINSECGKRIDNSPENEVIEKTEEDYGETET